jgi:hypothetical protein
LQEDPADARELGQSTPGIGDPARPEALVSRQSKAAGERLVPGSSLESTYANEENYDRCAFEGAFQSRRRLDGPGGASRRQPAGAMIRNDPQPILASGGEPELDLGEIDGPGEGVA